MSNWKIEQSRQLYNIGIWDEGYVEILDNGHLAVKPERSTTGVVDLIELVNTIDDLDLSMPVLVRFLDVLHDRINRLAEAFNSAFQSNSYTGTYTCVYPIKVNQQQAVVEEIAHNEGQNVGLEAGSKAELLAVYACLRDDKDLVVCNGYKDKHYIRHALIGQLLDYRVIIVVEKISELKNIIEEAKRLGVKPELGVRVRLAATGKGNWQNSGGDKSKFGLSATQVIRLLEYLEQETMLDCLSMLHIHMGSQIADINDIKNGINEAIQFYCGIKKRCTSLSVINVGGGPGIDYESSASSNYFSINYNLSVYAKTIVTTIRDACIHNNIDHPDIITECGRVMVAHHAVLITNVIDAESGGTSFGGTEEDFADKIVIAERDDLNLLQNILNEVIDGELDNLSTAPGLIKSIHEAFTKGKISIEQRAAAEQCYIKIKAQVKKVIITKNKNHKLISEYLPVDNYYCNLSVFQSMPDAWGISQIFPVVPLQRLDEKPQCDVVLQDLTCDSDGKIEYYPCQGETRESLPLHKLKNDEDYFIGIFLVGAYQEILGDMHNLFGDTHVVNVRLDNKGKYKISDIERGDSVRDLLNYVHYDTEQLLMSLNAKLACNISNSQLLQELKYELSSILDSYTYHEDICS